MITFFGLYISNYVHTIDFSLTRHQTPRKSRCSYSFFIRSVVRRETIFKRTLNDTANNSENLIRPSQASSFGTNHPTSTHFVLQPQNNLSELNNNLKIIVNNFSTCPTTRRKMPLRRHQTFNLATNPHACLLYFLVQSASTYISSTILITTTTIQSH